MREFIIPNYHVILVHYPLALVTIGLLIELLSFLWRRSAFRAAGRWMLLIGALSAISAATSGIYAARNVLSSQENLTWHDLKQSSNLNSTTPSLTADKWHTLHTHVLVNSIATGLLAVLVVVWVGCSDKWRSRLHLLFLAWLLVATAMMTNGAWQGGEMVYRHAIGVNTDLPGADTIMAHDRKIETEDRVESIFPPIQIHVMAAGWTVAMALVSLGLAIRAISMSRRRADWEITSPGDLDLASALNERTGEIGMPPPVREPMPADLEFEDTAIAVVPAARFWLITTLLAIATAVAGIWTFGDWNLKDLIDALRDSDQSRAMAHAVVGVTIIVLTLVLAILARWSKHSKLMLSVFSLLMILALAAQVWLGVLMLFDTSGGPLTRFN